MRSPRRAVPDGLDDLREQVRGRVLEPGESGYDDARSVWNARIDAEPAAIVRVTGAADVVASVALASERGWPLTVKGGGHHVSGAAIGDGALTIDTSPMDGVLVDPADGTATVQAGATVGDVDHETQSFGLATPMGQDPNIGVGGMTLGGGFGWLSREYGLAIDNLRSVDLVTAGGELVTASEDRNPELFWALRGGGGNFGVATTFEFDLHEVGPEVLGGSLIHPIEDAATVARGYREFIAEAPREVGVLFDLRDCPPAPTFPESIHGERVAMLVVCYHGDDLAAGEEALAPLRGVGDPLVDTIGERTYLAMQRAGESQGDMRTDVRGQFVPGLGQEVVETVVEAATRDLPPGETSIFLAAQDGAVTDLDPDATAYPHREENYYVLAEARWTDPAEDEAHVEWVRAANEALLPHATGGAIGNFLAADERAERARAAYGENLDRLVEIKRRWDPENVFDANVNVDPGWDA